MARHRVLVVEDDAPIRQGIVDALRFAGYDTLEAADFETARRLAVQESYDLLLLDLVLPSGGPALPPAGRRGRGSPSRAPSMNSETMSYSR